MTRKQIAWYIGSLVLVFSLALACVLIASDAECYACQNHLCVEHFDCPDGCVCARSPWHPQGECV